MDYYKIIHRKCGGVAFMLADIVLDGSVSMSDENAFMPDGTRPKNGQPVICGHCGQEIHT